jgi:glyoxylase-like metal-dependent hydrolase (beta-lactamase superfamily II)
MRVDVIETPELGDRSYVVSEGIVAVVIDPQRDLDRIYALIADLGVRVRLVCETHRHNDYVTGGFALAEATGATYAVPMNEDVRMPRVPVADGEVIDVGSLRVAVVDTPGHTEGSVCLMADDEGLLFSGDTLFAGGWGRVDLPGGDAALMAESIARLAGLDDPVGVFPGHGATTTIKRTTADGVEHDWGEVTIWEPPNRLGYMWHLRRDRADATEVEIRFVPSGAAATRVEIEHRNWERLGADGETWRDRNRGGWETLLPHYVAAATNAG